MPEGEGEERVPLEETMRKVDPALPRSIHRISDQHRFPFRMQCRMAYYTMVKILYKNWHGLRISGRMMKSPYPPFRDPVRNILPATSNQLREQLSLPHPRQGWQLCDRGDLGVRLAVRAGDRGHLPASSRRPCPTFSSQWPAGSCLSRGSRPSRRCSLRSRQGCTIGPADPRKP